MAEYIDREAAIKEIENDLPEQVHYSREDAADCIRYMDTADVAPVVHCKDCKHLMFSDCYGECGAARMGIVSPDDFCSYGERRTDE